MAQQSASRDRAAAMERRMSGLVQLWTILGDAPAPPGFFGDRAKKRWVRARCACGTVAVRARRDIEKNRSRSCGCASVVQQREIHRAFVASISKAARARVLQGTETGQ
jgi:hypothetical protein